MNMKLLALFLLPLAAACSSGPIAKAALDDEVRRLCAIDGGIKVYETVTLPAKKFNKWGQIDFWIPNVEEMKPDDEYYYERKIQYLINGNPELSRSQHKIIRRKDGMLLGESIRYARGGGDLAGPWHDSTVICPEPTVQPSLEASIFLRKE